MKIRLLPGWSSLLLGFTVATEEIDRVYNSVKVWGISIGGATIGITYFSYKKVKK